MGEGPFYKRVPPPQGTSASPKALQSAIALDAELGVYLVLRRQRAHIIAHIVGVRVLAEGRSLAARMPGSAVVIAVV